MLAPAVRPAFKKDLPPSTVAKTGLSLAVTATGNPLPDILWYKDGRLLELDSKNVQIVQSEGASDQTSTLFVKQLLPAAVKGVYQSMVQTSVGHALTSTVVVNSNSGKTCTVPSC